MAIIGSKEVKVDSQISRAEMPVVTGSAAEYENDLELLPQSQPSPLIVARTPSTSQGRSPSISAKETHAVLSGTAKKSVPATSFYALAQPKPKPKGPLCVYSLLSCRSIVALNEREHNLGMILTPTVRLSCLRLLQSTLRSTTRSMSWFS